MKSLEEKMQEIINFIDIFFHRKNGNWIAVDYIPEEDINDVAWLYVVALMGNNICSESRCYKKRIYDYHINFKCKKAEENDIILNKDRLFSEKSADIIFMIKDSDVFKDLYVNIFNPWFKKYYITQGPIEMIMCVPPEQDDPDYREHMNEYIKNKIEGKI